MNTNDSNIEWITEVGDSFPRNNEYTQSECNFAILYEIGPKPK